MEEKKYILLNCFIVQTYFIVDNLAPDFRVILIIVTIF